jgi:C-terminal processing protease CtpA/Prc
MTIKNLIILSIILLNIGCSSSKKAIDYNLIKSEPVCRITAGKVDTLRRHIEHIHPNIYMGVDSISVDLVAEQIVSDNEDKLLSVADFTLEMRRMTDMFHHVDPHLIYYPYLQVKEGFEGKLTKVKVIPFELYNINDTLLVKKSYTPLLKKGDRIISINNYPIDEFRRYIYPTWRSVKGSVMQLQSQVTFSEQYQIKLERQGDVKEFEVEGVDFNHATGERFVKGHMLDAYQTGYCKISQFSANNFIFKELRKLIEETKSKGYNNFIIDLRGNPGGSGYKMDAMFSLMSDKDSLFNMESQFIKVSSKTKKQYKFLKECSKGQLVEFPDKLTVRTVPLKRKLYQGKLNYFVLVDRSTASVAASFANIFQNNDLGELVGEPLDHNALNFGDVVASRAYQNLIISTVQYNEFSKSENGILTPDILILYQASAFENTDCPILDELLHLIEGRNTTKPKANNI